MAGLVLISSSVFQLNFSAKLKVSASKSATTQSRKPLCDSQNQNYARNRIAKTEYLNQQ